MPRNARVYTLKPAGLFDRGDKRVMVHEGKEVQKIQPAGCPRNGTMDMCYVQLLDGQFIGLVSLNSLEDTGRTAPVIDLGALAREARSRRLFGRTR